MTTPLPNLAVWQPETTSYNESEPTLELSRESLTREALVERWKKAAAQNHHNLPCGRAYHRLYDLGEPVLEWSQMAYVHRNTDQIVVRVRGTVNCGACNQNHQFMLYELHSLSQLQAEADWRNP